MCFCGNEISTLNNNNGQNYIKYSETKTSKSFEATFSNETAGAVVETFAQFLPLKKISLVKRRIYFMMHKLQKQKI